MASAVDPGFVCVRCDGSLPFDVPLRITCPGCGLSYPKLLFGIPVLMLAADAHLAATTVEIAAYQHKLHRSIADLTAKIAAGSPRAPALERIRDGARSIAALAQRWSDALATSWAVPDPPPAPPPAGAPPAAPFQAQYLIRDWSGRPAAEEVVATITGSLDRLLAAAPDDQAAVVLGAGAGRFAWEVAGRFGRVVALERSLPFVLSQAFLRTGPVDLCDPADQNVPSVQALCVRERCRIPAGEPARLARLRWAVADALHAPVAPASASAVLSVYFTDLVSGPALVREAWRMLKPGGVFVHFGTLGYIHEDYESMLTPDELAALIGASGFRLVADEWVEHALWPGPGLAHLRMRAYGCAAVKAV